MTTNAVASGWLADQLPHPLSEDHFTRQFLRIFEDVASSVRTRVTSFQHDLDAGVAPVEFVQWMGQWLAVGVQPFIAEERQRALVAAAGALWKRRGTKVGLQGLLEALTGSEVSIDDGGGVFSEGEAPPNAKKVVVSLSDRGGLTDEQLLDFVRVEIPANATVEVTAKGRTKPGATKRAAPAPPAAPADDAGAAEGDEEK